MQLQRSKEIEEVKKLQVEIEQEKVEKIQKRKKERDEAQKIIKANEEEKKKRVALKEAEKMEQIKLMEDYNRILDQQEKQRAEEFERRDKRIRDAMNRMGDVKKKSDKAEKEFELKILKESL